LFWSQTDTEDLVDGELLLRLFEHEGIYGDAMHMIVDVGVLEIVKSAFNSRDDAKIQVLAMFEVVKTYTVAFLVRAVEDLSQFASSCVLTTIEWKLAHVRDLPTLVPDDDEQLEGESDEDYEERLNQEAEDYAKYWRNRAEPVVDLAAAAWAKMEKSNVVHGEVFVDPDWAENLTEIVLGSLAVAMTGLSLEQIGEVNLGWAAEVLNVLQGDCRLQAIGSPQQEPAG
jgi:hypothetical protein